MEDFLAFVSRLAKQEIDRRKISGIEEIGLQVGLLDIFQSNYDPEKTYYELLEFLEKQQHLSSITPEVKKFYQTNYLNK